MFDSDTLTFEIDLNMLDGDHVRSHVEFMTSAPSRKRPPEAGETVWAIDEDGAQYAAVVESLSESGFVDLRLKLESRKRVAMQIKSPATAFLSSGTVRTYTTATPPALDTVQ
jgi:hypothetical protein